MHKQQWECTELDLTFDFLEILYNIMRWCSGRMWVNKVVNAVACADSFIHIWMVSLINQATGYLND